jgi:hypothetical protein
VIKAGGMEDRFKCDTPETTTPVGSGIDGDLLKEHWEYASIVGKPMYIASHTRPDIAYSVHQAARYSHGTR